MNLQLIRRVQNKTALKCKGQIPLRYPASEPAGELVRELVCDLRATC